MSDLPLINATIGVPVDIAVPLFLRGLDRKQCYQRFALCTSITVPMADEIVCMVRAHPTISAYDVHGGVTGDGVEEQLVDAKIAWSIRKPYLRLLKRTRRKYKQLGMDVPIEKVVLLDQSFRMKRCRQTTRVTDEYGTARALVWYQYSPPEGSPPLHRTIGQWFDVSLSTEPVRSSRTESKESLQLKQRRAAQATSRQCATCGRYDTLASPFRKCGGRCYKSANPAIYCSRDCQKLDWPTHKATCYKR